MIESVLVATSSKFIIWQKVGEEIMSHKLGDVEVYNWQVMRTAVTNISHIEKDLCRLHAAFILQLMTSCLVTVCKEYLISSRVISYSDSDVHASSVLPTYHQTRVNQVSSLGGTEILFLVPLIMAA